jgi:hypothetical protein
LLIHVFHTKMCAVPDSLPHRRHGLFARLILSRGAPLPYVQPGHTPLLIALALFLSAISAECVSIGRLNGGQFVYTLDDAYIHLALAENIRRGHYGVNSGEPSSPSSSILWPFLLAPFAQTSWATYVPLTLNVLFSLATLVLFRVVIAQSLGPSRPFLVTGLIILLMLSTNAVGLVFIGMEHSLQLLLTVAVAVGLTRQSDRARLEPWAQAAIVLGPLVRYENLGVSFAAILYLALRRRLLQCTLLLTATLAPLGLFSWYLTALGLDPLPTSVLVKSDVAAAGGQLAALWWHLRYITLDNDRGVLLAVCLLLFLARVLFEPVTSKRMLAASGCVAVTMHLLAGSYGFTRYEVYIWAFSLALLAPLYSAQYRLLASAHPAKTTLLSIAAAGLLCFRYLTGLVSLPIAANNIYEQQYQMHRFATEFYTKPVGVNDIGYVSWRNDFYVLDFWGLASREALTLRTDHSEPRWMSTLARRHGVEVAMIYPDWFAGDLPPSWVKLGELRLGRRRVTPASPKVSFYAVDASAASAASAALRRFSPTLPGDAVFLFASPTR